MKRDWSDAQAKREPCRICSRWPVELAHVTGRTYDPQNGKGRYVRPESVVPLCPDHHRMYDSHELNLLPYLEREEQVAAVSDLGLYAAYIRTASVSRAERDPAWTMDPETGARRQP